MQFPTLYQRSGNSQKQWAIEVEQTSASESTMVITHGKLGGKQKVSRHTIRAGKNIGKSNETTPHQQAIAEAQARWNKKKDREGYDTDISASDDKVSLKPMKALVYEKQQHTVDWLSDVFVQPKFDGHRAQAFKVDGRVVVVGKTGLAVESIPHICAELEDLIPDGVRLDGELYRHGVPLNTLASWIRKPQPNSAKLQFYSYDLVSPAPFVDRFAQLSKILDQVTHSVLVPTHRISAFDEAKAWHDKFVAQGYEGAMLRHGAKGYRPGKRVSCLLKIKEFLDDEFEIVGYKEGKGDYEGMAVFYMVTEAGNRFEAIAPGTHEDKRKAWEERDSYIGKWMTIKYQYMTKSEKPVPFLPVAKCLREDI